MLENAPKEVGTRGRLYTTERERAEIDVNPTPYGRETPITVALVTMDRDPEWVGVFKTVSGFETEIGYYGEIQIPVEVRRRHGIVEGDHLRLTVASV